MVYKTCVNVIRLVHFDTQNCPKTLVLVNLLAVSIQPFSLRNGYKMKDNEYVIRLPNLTFTLWERVGQNTPCHFAPNVNVQVRYTTNDRIPATLVLSPPPGSATVGGR